MSNLILPEAFQRRRQLAIDLTRYHFVRTRGQWRLFGTWYLATKPGVPAKRCLVIVDRTKKLHADYQRPFVLVDDAMFRMHEGEWDMGEVMMIVAKFFVSQGLIHSNSPADRRTKANFISLIVDHLDDLKDMPMAPPRPKADMGEATVKINGAKIQTGVHVDV